MRNLRDQHKLTQKDCADRLGISPSYLNQIENNQRPLTAAVILALVEEFKADISKFTTDDSSRRLSDLREILVDPMFSGITPSLQELKIATSNTPEFTAAFLALHNAYQSTQEKLASVDDLLQNDESSLKAQPYEEVRDFFHYENNYIDALDRAGEDFNMALDLSGGAKQKLVNHLRTHHGVDVQYSDALPAHQLRHTEGKVIISE